MADQLELVRGRHVGGGSRKGIPNKTTVAVRNAIVDAFERVGGADYLEQVARQEPKVFCVLLAKVLPKQAPESGAATVATLSDAEIRQRVAGMLREGLSPAGIETGEVVDAVEVSAKPDAS